MKKAHRAFTLVELLIVIIIIGTLAGMMMLAAGSATSKAEATKIVANLRTLKSAVMMYEAENVPFPNNTIHG
ncbi:MAG: prepilin-type N-terminal cleavage/methylation domain-containing protein [Synergistaceae bacterium]|nr:prepilin-type N-terminal cleavage/methylation domain-containing protein [Synergistaceae bacterium]